MASLGLSHFAGSRVIGHSKDSLGADGFFFGFFMNWNLSLSSGLSGHNIWHLFGLESIPYVFVRFHVFWPSLDWPTTIEILTTTFTGGRGTRCTCGRGTRCTCGRGTPWAGIGNRYMVFQKTFLNLACSYFQAFFKVARNVYHGIFFLLNKIIVKKSFNSVWTSLFSSTLLPPHSLPCFSLLEA